MSTSPARRERRRFRKQLSDKAAFVPFVPEGDGALDYRRQSFYSDESLSSETQGGHNSRWCAAYGVPVVGTVEDLHVSGDLDMFKRAGLREWLSDAPPRPWKTLIVAKLDRVSRNALDTLRLLSWLRARGKRLVSVAEGIDTSNSMGDFLLTVVAAIAEMERTRMRERFRDSKASLQAEGRWSGEAHVYGTMPVELPNRGGWILGIDAYAVKILHSVSKLARAGKSLKEMCDWLNDKQVLSPSDRRLQLSAERKGMDPGSVELKGYKWQGTVLRPLLENPDLVAFGIFEPAEQSEILARLEEKARRKSRGSNQPYDYSGVFVCTECLEPLWHRRAHRSYTRQDGTVTEHQYDYWRCPTTQHGPSMRAAEIEPVAEESFYIAFAQVPVRERVVLPPTDHANEIAKLEREYGKVMGEVARIKSLEERQRRTAEGTKILADIDMLRALPVDPGGVRWVPTGRTWREELKDKTPQERRERWLDLGFRFAAQKHDDESMTFGWLLPEGWQDEMPELADKVPPTGFVDMTDLVGQTGLTMPPATPSDPADNPGKPDGGNCRKG